jgi:hypothetical protein
LDKTLSERAKEVADAEDETHVDHSLIKNLTSELENSQD